MEDIGHDEACLVQDVTQMDWMNHENIGFSQQFVGYPRLVI
jgi:hypothetical protein